MNRLSRLLTISVACVGSTTILADLAWAQGGAGGQGQGQQPRQPGGRQPGGNNPGGGGGGGGGGQRGGGGGGFGGMFGGGGGGGRQMFDQPSVTSEDMTKYGKILELTKSQQDAIKTLHTGYAQEYTAAATKARDEVDAIREEARDDPSRFQDLRDVFTKFQAKRTEMETSFFNDVKDTLTPAQKDKWPVIERTRRRESTIGRGLMSGERVDLVKIVDNLKLAADARKPVDPILDEYQIDLDRALVARNAVQDKLQEQFRDVREIMSGGGDTTKMQKAIEDGRAAGNKVREVNKRFARQVETALPDEATRTKFNEEVRKESFPTIYRGNSYATRVVDSAAALESLTAEQKMSIKQIKDQYTRELGGINQKSETAYEQREQSITAADIMSRFGGGGGGGGGGQRGGGGMVDSEELTALREQRRELENSTVEKIQNLLNEEQKAALPQRGGRGGDNAPAGGGAGGRGNNGGNDNGGGNQAPRRRPRGNGGGGGDQPTPPNGRT